jgi:hypothetical protein
MVCPGFMALVGLFLGAGELIMTPVPKDKQVRTIMRVHAAAVIIVPLQLDWEAILRLNVKEFVAFVDPWFVRQP